MIWTHRLIISLFAVAISYSSCLSAELPVCSNRIINEVTKRAGCTVGDTRCWLTKGGFCTDYVENKIRHDKLGSSQLSPINTRDVKKGDIAQFNNRVHYAYIERVVRDKSGRPVTVDLSEYNYGTCWVDSDAMVTDQYMVVNKRFGVGINSVDGGFLRAQ